MSGWPFGDQGPDALWEWVEHAERSGVDSIWLTDRIVAERLNVEPVVALAFVAARTKRMLVGTSVLALPLRQPTILAKEIATLDFLSAGRMLPAIGLGTEDEREYEAAGVARADRGARTDEMVEVMRLLWSGEPVNWDGRWTVKGGELAPKPYTPGGPPIWSGGGVPAALKRAGRYFEGWFPSGPGNGKDWTKSWAQVREDAREAGRDPDALTGAAYVTVAVDDDSNKANAELDDYLESYYLQPAERIRTQQYCFAGNRGEVTEWLNDFVEGGATHLSLRFTGTDDDRQMETLVKMRADLS